MKKFMSLAAASALFLVDNEAFAQLGLSGAAGGAARGAASNAAGPATGGATAGGAGQVSGQAAGNGAVPTPRGGVGANANGATNLQGATNLSDANIGGNGALNAAGGVNQGVVGDGNVSGVFNGQGSTAAGFNSNGANIRAGGTGSLPNMVNGSGGANAGVGGINTLQPQWNVGGVGGGNLQNGSGNFHGDINGQAGQYPGQQVTALSSGAAGGSLAATGNVSGYGGHSRRGIFPLFPNLRHRLNYLR